jgi:phenylacetate-CoA ligase
MRKRSKVTFYDRRLETLSRKELEVLQGRRLRKLLEEVLRTNRFWQRKLRAAGICKPVPFSRLSDLPFTSKAEIVADQAAHPPFGTNLTFPLEAYTRLHQTSGTTGAPLRWLDTPESYQSFVTQWKFVYRGAGVGPGDRVFVAFSFGPFYGFWGAFDAAPQMGCLAMTGGGQTSEQRLVQIRDLRPTVLICTPTYALRLAEIATTMGIEPSKLGLRVSIHAGEPGASIPSTRKRIQKIWGVKAYDHCGMTEVGGVGFECSAQIGPHVNESEFILEVIDPKTTRPVEEGRGEIVLTTLGRAASPLIRYRTGDLADVVRKRCVCGRTFAHLRGGLLGRADDMMTVRGINVFPSAIENILRRFPEVVEFQGVVTRQMEMQELLLRLETDGLGEREQAVLGERIVAEMHTRLQLRPAVEFAPPGSLPRAEMKSRRFRVQPAV